MEEIDYKTISYEEVSECLQNKLKKLGFVYEFGNGSKYIFTKKGFYENEIYIPETMCVVAKRYHYITPKINTFKFKAFPYKSKCIDTYSGGYEHGADVELKSYIETDEYTSHIEVRYELFKDYLKGGKSYTTPIECF